MARLQECADAVWEASLRGEEGYRRCGGICVGAAIGVGKIPVQNFAHSVDSVPACPCSGKSPRMTKRTEEA